MVAVPMISMIGMITILALIIYQRFDREVIMGTTGEKIMYVVGIMTNQGKYYSRVHQFFFLLNFVSCNRGFGDYSSLFSSHLARLLASNDGRSYKCLHRNSYLTTNSPKTETYSTISGRFS